MYNQSFLAFIGLAILSSTALAAIGPVTDVHLSNGIVSPDGFSRHATLVEGVVDKTLITGTKGDTFKLNVINNLNDNTMNQTTSIHWHGLFQTNSSWADGPAMITQCPIAKGNSFLYQFTANQAGTFWYHSHVGVQYCDGLRGPLVIYDPNDPHKNLYDIDDDSTVITLSEWYHIVSLQQTTTLPTADSTLINGLGRSKDGPPTSPLSVITVTQGKRYRMRLLNIGCEPSYTLQIDGHRSLTVIEVDGISHQPLVVDQIEIFTAQRYSFVLNANQPIGNYWIRATPNRGDTGFNNGVNSAILRYVGANTVEPTTSQDKSSNALNEANLAPLENVAAPGSPAIGGADQVFNLTISNSGGRFAINGVSFEPPTVPVLLQILSGARTASSLLPSGSVFALQPNAVIEVTVGVTGGQGPHPFHLHGHVFHVIRSAGSKTYNYVNPPQRDVVNTGGGGDHVTFRFVTDNPGPWFLHCHIDWHLNAGLAVVFAEDAPDWAATTPVPDAWKELCPIFDRVSPADL